MFVNRNTLANLMPPRRPRVTRSTGHHGWNLRRGAVGVEIRGTSLHVACLRLGWNRRWLTATGVIPDFAQLDDAGLRAQMKQVLGKAAGDDPIVALGVPRRDVMVRHLQLPGAAAKSLDSVLNLQLALYRPSDEEEFCWDAAVAAHGEQLGVSLMFAPRARIEESVQRMSGAGFAPSLLTTVQFATLDWSLRGMPDADKVRLLLLQACDGEAELAIVERGCCTLTRGFVLPADGRAEYVAGEIRKALATHRASATDACTVVVSGQGATPWRSLLAEFGEVKELPQHCDAFALTETTNASEDPEPFWGAIALALNGLAWSGKYRVNLLPRDLRAERRRWRNAPTYALLLVNVLLLGALAFRAPLQRHVMLRRYNSEIARVEGNASLVEHQFRKRDQLEGRLATLREFQERGRQPLDALSEVAQKLPADAWIGAYTCRQGQVDLTGTAKSASAVLPALKASMEFQDVQFAGGLARDSDGAERFHILMKLRSGQ